MKLNNVSATITFDLPSAGVSSEEVAAFICDALECMGGCRHPNDPLFSSLSVKKIRIGHKVYENEEPKKF